MNYLHILTFTLFILTYFQIPTALYALFCSGTNNINQIILTAITNTINSTNLDLSSNTISQLIQTIYNHPAFHLSPALLFSYYIQTTLKGLIPSHFIQDLRPFYLSTKLASQIIIKILLQVSELSYEQLWKPYCSQFASWRKTNNITYPSSTTSNISQSKKQPSLRRTFTYSCSCGQPDQLHINPNSCPPIGTALKKNSSWAVYWFEEDFINWTSGYNDIDNFIKATQLKADNADQYLEWIPFMILLAASLYTANWARGPTDNWNANENKFTNRSLVKVALVAIGDSL
ncbi:hypothetical protein C2G38_2164780 [Gigaspora rosea]|uniref:Uncharacterized protein n=1 Tax=Gigaspora rosea TaxID=44941 RepID=A0A397VY39_9GLOM|nr:hypothetical protein C2G38_2164780 [Gigaspora rosea]